MTTLVRNVQVVLSGADAAKRVDILISGNKISGIGSFPKKQADRVIDGQGCYASSGFIDVHDSSDHYGKFFEREAWDGAIKSGITTVIAGHEGVSLAPMLHKNSYALFKPWSDVSGLTSGWQMMKEFLKYAGGLKLPVNAASFAGADSLSLGPENKRSDVLGEALIAALNGGAAGLSMDMAGMDERAFSTKEMHELRGIVSAHKKSFSIRLDTREKIEPQMKAIASFLAKAECRVVVSCLALSLEKYSTAHGYFEEYFGKNKNVFFDGGTLAGSLVEASRLLPGWVLNNEKDILEQLKDEWTRKRIIADIVLPDAKLFVAYADKHEDLVGHTLEDIARRFEANVRNDDESGHSVVSSVQGSGTEDKKLALIELLRVSRLRASLYAVQGGTFEPVRGSKEEDIFADRNTLFGTFSAGVFHPLHAAVMGSYAAARPYGALVENAYRRGFVHVSHLVDALVRRPAAFYALKERGELSEGYFADMVIFNSEIKYTLVNGAVAYDGLRTFPSPGRMIAL